MFTGIIEETGKIESIKLSGNSGIIKINAAKILEGTKIGDSISVNGVCLTVTEIDSTGFTADVMAETVRRSNIGKLTSLKKVNLERAMSADGRFGGHIVSGHIDGTGVIKNIVREENAIWFYINAEEKILSLVIEKGSIAINGISLTVAFIGQDEFGVSVIPHTAQLTTLGNCKIGDVVNLENDVIGKYVQRLLNPHTKQKSIDEKILSFLGD